MSDTARGEGPLDRDGILQLWEAQQAGYVHQRAQRFGVILDTLDYRFGSPELVLDAGAGPGSLSKLILERFPAARVVVLDHDPALLELARHNLREHLERVQLVDADLLDRNWSTSFEGTPQAIVSSTALHWLPADGVLRFLQEAAQVLADGGLFLNADHYEAHIPGSFFEQVSVEDDRRLQRRSFDGTGIPDWPGWWDRFAEVAGFEALLAERNRRYAASREHPDATPGLHIEALKLAGFREAGTLWQYFDDYIVYGLR